MQCGFDASVLADAITLPAALVDRLLKGQYDTSGGLSPQDIQQLDRWGKVWRGAIEDFLGQWIEPQWVDLWKEAELQGTEIHWPVTPKFPEASVSVDGLWVRRARYGMRADVFLAARGGEFGTDPSILRTIGRARETARQLINEEGTAINVRMSLMDPADESKKVSSVWNTNFNKAGGVDPDFRVQPRPVQVQHAHQHHHEAILTVVPHSEIVAASLGAQGRAGKRATLGAGAARGGRGALPDGAGAGGTHELGPSDYSVAVQEDAEDQRRKAAAGVAAESASESDESSQDAGWRTSPAF